MRCAHFGVCGSCTLHAMGYPAQVAHKMAKLTTLLAPFYQGVIVPFTTPSSAYRARAEYRIYHDQKRAYYAMHRLDKKGFVALAECPMPIEAIQRCMEPLLDSINRDPLLKEKLFGVEFLSGRSGEVLVTMLYHRPLDGAWQEAARSVQKALGVAIIGRSRGQKIVLDREYITEKLTIYGRTYYYRHYEQSFTQPNPFVNEKMIAWLLSQAQQHAKGNLCELYAGSGNFTIPMASHFSEVVATEISKRSIKAAWENSKRNGVENITFMRMSSEEFTQAIRGERSFRRLEGIDLLSKRLESVLVDPPRAGLDEESRRLVGTFKTIFYISCNPESLVRDLESLDNTHRVVAAALFDQFAYTPHIEAGVVLCTKDLI